MQIECRLNIIFAARGIKKGWFAARVGVNPGTLSAWCTGKSYPELSQAYRVAEELNMPVEEIWQKK